MKQISLPFSGPAVLACGAWLKNTVCLADGEIAYVSDTVGDLSTPEACMAHEVAVAGLLEHTAARPASIAHDLHPDFHSSRFAASFAKAHDLPLLAVQHHHAHIAAVMGEHGVAHNVLGLALDGVGLGMDGKVWGGELLRVGADGELARLGHLAELAMPGGDKAAQEPWRMAASVLHRLGRGKEIMKRFAQPAAATVSQMLEKQFNCPATSSAGRWFDAAAGLLGVCDVMQFEAEAAIKLEKLASAHGPVAPLAQGFVLEADGTLDLYPLMQVLADTGDAGYGAALFHHTLAHALFDWVAAQVRRSGLRSVVLAGGCFLNAILEQELRVQLEKAGYEILQPKQLSPGDTAIAFGQAYVALLQGRKGGT